MYLNMICSKKSAPDYRDRRDRSENLVNGWDTQMDRMVHAYMAWCTKADLGSSREETPRMVEEFSIMVVDLYGEIPQFQLVLYGLDGLVPCLPWDPSVAIATRVLKLYRTTHVRCPQLAIQAFVKSLCDLHGFSIAYDLYLELSCQTDALVNSALGRDAPNWRLKHTCPACMYKLEGEDALIFSILTTMDGNDSLKRVLRRSKTDGSEEEPTLGPSKERDDPRDGGEDYFLSRDRVDKWSKGRVADILPTDANNPCSDRWKNMINNITSKMWGIFDETGIFLGLCRHGFVLVVADMIRSSELAKYPLAIVEVLLEAFGLKIGGSYDIGCHFGMTLNNSELGTRLVPINSARLLCQLSFLATYVEGMGLEDLEGCEHYFSRSNGLAKSVRYASKFHRRQEITTFMKQMDDLETYANLSKFLCDNYRQTLKILQTEPGLKRWMVQEGIDDYDTFHVWLEEEKEYLLGLDNGLPKKREETLEMEYVQKLVNFEASQCAQITCLRTSHMTHAALADDADFDPASVSQVARRHATEQRNRDAELVEHLELQLKVEVHWTSSSPEWIAAAAEIRNHKYQNVLDKIEEIIVERLLEMTKIHQSGTGYKLRSHIAKALQARSKGIQNAIDRYNEVALAMAPPMPTLSWDEVVNYGFLAEFDILRDTRDSIWSRPWTCRNYCLEMDSYFKILRAREEIKRLNIEIRRVISIYRLRRSRSDTIHMNRFWALAKTPGFTGSVIPGVSIELQKARDGGREAMEVVSDVRTQWAPVDQEWRGEEDEGEVAESETVAELMYQVSMLAVDRAEGGGIQLDLE
ncbi:hypothetical protein K438DRAFT_1907156 [Mycena galopus ATCC 62051]|nr:hypothetical protein K438DRAFT_1907156 [Mycena galopus ATCC 62051]